MDRIATMGCVIGLACCSVASGEEAKDSQFRIRPVQIISMDQLPEDLEIGAKNSLAMIRPGFQIHYLIQGKDIAFFDSVVFDKMTTLEGIDISKDKFGLPAYRTWGFFPVVNADRKYCLFAVAVDDNQFGKVDKLSIKGRAKVFTASETELKEFVVQPTGDKGVAFGPFNVKVNFIPKGASNAPQAGPADAAPTELPPAQNAPAPPDKSGAAAAAPAPAPAASGAVPSTAAQAAPVLARPAALAPAPATAAPARATAAPEPSSGDCRSGTSPKWSCACGRGRAARTRTIARLSSSTDCGY
jgi:hypothetical protein